MIFFRCVLFGGWWCTLTWWQGTHLMRVALILCFCICNLHRFCFLWCILWCCLWFRVLYQMTGWSTNSELLIMCKEVIMGLIQGTVLPVCLKELKKTTKICDQGCWLVGQDLNFEPGYYTMVHGDLHRNYI